mmetsp:Transcript_15081/g.17554  ORF Transcript_15081/g.17554 Transcript_15081/m.17554 type:complete len:394 (-) Transcript_15081:75-1256(-)
MKFSTVFLTAAFVSRTSAFAPTAKSTISSRNVLPQSETVLSEKIANNILELVGNTPLVKLSKVVEGCGAEIVAKLESSNPANSVKDRIALSMITQAEERGDISPGKTTLVEPTSGNTGIGLAMVAASKGYKLILTMPESMSMERRVLLKAFGADLVLTPAAKGMGGAISKAEDIVDSLGEDGYLLQQFNNPDNPKIHRETTGPEIWRDTDGLIDIFVSGCGTGGTVTGVSQFIKGSEEHGCPPLKSDLWTVAVEPQEQMLITEAKGGEKVGPQGPHRIQGMGPGLVPKVLDLDYIDEVVAIHSDEATDFSHELWMEGLPVGISSGAIVAAAAKICARPESAGKMVCCIIPSFGERYFTHPMFTDVKAKAEALAKQPLPEPFDNTAYGFATTRG